MNIENLQKGLAVVVGDNCNQSNKTDLIVAFDSNCMSFDKVVMLSNCDFNKVTQDVIYVCGHGNRRKRTISGMTMSELAVKLKEQGYAGKQKLCIVSCFGKFKSLRSSMADQLKKLLAKLGIEADVTALVKHISVIGPAKSRDSFEIRDMKLSILEYKLFLTLQQIITKHETVEGEYVKMPKGKQWLAVKAWNDSFLHGEGKRNLSLLAIDMAFIFAYFTALVCAVGIALVCGSIHFDLDFLLGSLIGFLFGLAGIRGLASRHHLAELIAATAIVTDLLVWFLSFYLFTSGQILGSVVTAIVAFLVFAVFPFCRFSSRLYKILYEIA